jgi:hypothetical protein
MSAFGGSILDIQKLIRGTALGTYSLQTAGLRPENQGGYLLAQCSHQG